MTVRHPGYSSVCVLPGYVSHDPAALSTLPQQLSCRDTIITSMEDREEREEREERGGAQGPYSQWRCASFVILFSLKE